MYILDSNSFRVLEGYYPQTFQTFWDQFNELVRSGRAGSVEEVRKELDQRAARQYLLDWLEANKRIFVPPTPEDMAFVARIFAIPHFQQLIGTKQLARGDPVADPWIIARASSIAGTVVTEEKLKPGGAKIPNVCDHFGVECISLEQMLQREGWQY